MGTVSNSDYHEENQYLIRLVKVIIQAKKHNSLFQLWRVFLSSMIANLWVLTNSD